MSGADLEYARMVSEAGKSESVDGALGIQLYLNSVNSKVSKSISKLPSWMVLGDSISNNGGGQVETNGILNFKQPSNSSSTPVTNRSWQLWAQIYSEWRLSFSGSCARGGYTATQIKNEYLPVVLKSKPNYCVICVGQNDSTSDWANVGLVALESMVVSLLKSGIVPILATIPATNTASLKNVSIKLLAFKYGVPLVDWYAATADPATGVFISGYSSDGIHPVEPGVVAMGKALSDVFKSLIPFNFFSSWLATSNGLASGTATTGLALPDPLLQTDNAGSPIIPGQWTLGSVAASSSLSAPSNPDPSLGRKWTFTRGATDAWYHSRIPVTGTPKSGNKFLYAFRFGASVAGVTGAWKIDVVDANTQSIVLFDTGDIHTDVALGTLFAFSVVLPPSWVEGVKPRMRVWAKDASGASVVVAQPTFYDLTQMGLDGYI